MNMVTINTEVAANLCSKLSIFRNDTNKIRFQIGIKNVGNGLASKAIIVNGGCMAEIGFKTSLPKEEIEIPENGAWMSFILSASDFCSYLSALNAYNADITISYDGTIVELSIGDNVKVPLNTVNAEAAEPMLQHDFSAALVKIKADKNFLPALSKSGFLATPGTDSRGIVDRVVLRLKDGICYSYSTDSFSVAKAWSSVQLAYNEPQRALLFLREKGSGLDKQGQQALMAQMKPFQNDPAGLVELAKKEGFKTEEAISLALPATAFNAVQKLFSGTETLYLIVTPNNLHIQGDNLQTTFSLAGSVSSFYENAIDQWEKSKWNAKAVVDRDAFLKSLQLLKLGEKNTPFHLFFDKNSLAVSKGGTVVHSAVTGTEGDVKSINISLSVDKVITCISKLCPGNIIIRVMTDKKRETMPISVSNGDLTENVSSYAYIMTVREVTTAEEKTVKTSEETSGE